MNLKTISQTEKEYIFYNTIYKMLENTNQYIVTESISVQEIKDKKEQGQEIRRDRRELGGVVDISIISLIVVMVCKLIKLCI